MSKPTKREFEVVKKMFGFTCSCKLDCEMQDPDCCYYDYGECVAKALADYRLLIAKRLKSLYNAIDDPIINSIIKQIEDGDFEET